MYKQKYLKYKLKYLELKKIKGGMSKGIFDKKKEFIKKLKEKRKITHANKRFIIDNAKDNITITDNIYENNKYILKKTDLVAYDNICLMNDDTYLNIFFIGTDNYEFKYTLKLEKLIITLQLSIVNYINLDNDFKELEELLKSHSIKLIKLKDYCDITDAEIKSIKDKLVDLNIKLEKKCPKLKLEFNKLNDLTDETIISEINSDDEYSLCLFKESKCLSIISFKYEPFEEGYVINSNTDKHEYQKKYNKLLRAVLIIISNLIKGCGGIRIRIISLAINSISAYTLTSSYDYKFDEEFKVYFDDNKDKYSGNLLQLYNEAGKDNINPGIYIDNTPANEKKAIDIFDMLISTELADKQIKCE
tara:strand:+ start:118 stop:1200 length:1083 start_codon:yes stop_codon:yes gene_type:complete